MTACLTEAERRRAAGAPSFNSSPGMVRISEYILDAMSTGRITARELSSFWLDIVAARLRALVLQGLCDVAGLS